MLAALDELDARRRGTARSGPTSRTRTCTPRWSAGCSSGSARSAASCAPAAVRNDQVATDLRLYLRDHARAVVARRRRARRRRSRAGRAARRHAGARHDAPAARAAGAVRAPAARPRAGRSPATSTGCATGTARAAVSPLGAGALAGSSLPLDPVSVAARARLRRRRRRTRSTPCRDRDFVAEFLFVAALLGVHLSRLGEEVVLWTTARVRLGRRSTTRSPPARRSCRRRRTPTSPSWPAARPAGSSATSTGLLAMLKGLPLPTTATCRRTRSRSSTRSTRCCSCCRRSPGMIATMTVDADALAAAAPNGFALATDVAERLVTQRRAVPRGARGGRAPRRRGAPCNELRPARRQPTTTSRRLSRT